MVSSIRAGVVSPAAYDSMDATLCADHRTRKSPAAHSDGALPAELGQTCALRTTRSCASEVARVSLANSTATIVITEAIAT